MYMYLFMIINKYIFSIFYLVYKGGLQITSYVGV